jgi:hypothetical protein
MTTSITERKLRQFIIETLDADLDEMALGDIKRYTGYNFSNRPSIGFHESEDPDYIDRVAELYSRSKDLWVIITIEDTVYTTLDSAHFTKWFKSQNFPKDAKIAVVFSSSLEGDLSGPNWLFVHDIIGHAAGKRYLDALGFRQGSGLWIKQAPHRLPLILRIHALLKRDYPHVFEVSDEGEAQFDKIYDLFAAIILGYLTYEEAAALANSPEEYELIDQLFAASQDWVDSIPNGVPTVIKPW